VGEFQGNSHAALHVAGSEAVQQIPVECMRDIAR